ncbi:MAG: HdeD family acid-resistance protein [Chloroflexi bacterium]|nr:HdeD family acid-resistance protein [Chloroflexota bacterium]
MLAQMARNWWSVAIRGVLAVIFGLLVLFFPIAAIATLVLLFGAYALIDGLLAIYMAITRRSENERWWVMLLEGLAGVIAGILTFIWPAITGLVLLYLIAAWALITGIIEIIAAIQLRKEIENELWLALGGVASVIFGIVAFISPGAGALAVTWLIGVYAIIFGIALILLGFRLRNMSATMTQAMGGKV